MSISVCTVWIQVKKCDSTDCWYCTMHQKRIENLDKPPDPVFNTSGSVYLPFNQEFGTPTTDTAKPSLKEKLVSTESDKQNKSVLVAGIYKYFTY